jgi:hypothetical protein
MFPPCFHLRIIRVGLRHFMAAIGMVQRSSVSHVPIDHASPGNLLTACFAPAAMYILIYGDTVHFAYLFIAIILSRFALTLDILSLVKTQFLTNPSDDACTQKPFAPAQHLRVHVPIRPGVTLSRGRLSSARSPNQASRPKTPISPTLITSSDTDQTKQRRALLNKVSPEKLDDVCEKLVSTFPASSTDQKGVVEVVGLIFAASSRQPQYNSVFAELLYRLVNRLLPRGSIEDILVNECQMQWSTICLQPVERTKGWSTLSEDDRIDARTRYKSRQLAVAEFCGLIASRGLIPPAYPLSWLEALMQPVASSAWSGPISAGSTQEIMLEIICSGIRGLGLSETEGHFTDIDALRFDYLCNTLAALQPAATSRSKCLIQDIIDLRNSGWTQNISWKKALIPTRRLSANHY